jgi:hypothetical protein
MRKIFGKIIEIDEDKILIQATTDVPHDLKKELEMEENNLVVLEYSKHLIIIKKV